MHLLLSCSTVLLLSIAVNAFYTPRPYWRTTRNRPATESTAFDVRRTTFTSGTTPTSYGSATSNTGTFSSSRPQSTTAAASITTSSPSVTTEDKTKTTESPSTATEKTTTTGAPETEIARFNDSIYRFTSYRDSVEGEEFCKRLGGLWNLASIHSQAENDFVLAHLAAEFPGAAAAWLGGFKEGGRMTWIDGKPWNFENWAAGESEDDGDCLQLLLNANGKWRSENCASNSAAVVCKCTGEHCPLPEKPDEVIPGAFNASDYHLAVDMDSVEGEEYCKRLGGLSNLASIHSAAENQFIAALVKKQHPEAKTAVIGGYRAGDAFAWIDGSSWDFEAWGEGHPASGNTDGCTYMTFTGELDGKWVDEFCGERADVVVCRISSK